MDVRHNHHNRVAIAALFLCFVVATMTVTLARGNFGEPPTASDQQPQTNEESRAGLLSASCNTPVSIQAPRSDFASVVAQHPAGTCFVLEAGTYTFHDVVPKDDMTFVGVATDTVIVDGNGYENAFHGTADGVTIADMTFRNFNDSAGTTRQEQAPIRGTAAIWQSDRGVMATNWLITDIVSHSNYASGLFLGEHWVVRNSIFHSNGVTGIGGDELLGGLIEKNIIHSNGAQQAQGALVNGGGMKITQAGTPTHPVVVRNNEFYDNQKIAIWCDIGCDGFHVIDNYIHDHYSRGVMYELSSNLVVRGNTILRSNTWTNFAGDWNAAAITVGESRDALVENNLIDDAKAGVVIRQTNRPASSEAFLNNYPYVNWVSSNVNVRNNIISNTGKMGISTGLTGAGQITQPETIVFTGNTYDNAGAMNFWWNNGQQVTFADWQAAGRDTTPSGSQSSSPMSQTRGPQSGNWLAYSPTTTTAAPTTTVPPTTPPPTSAPTSAPTATTAPATSAPPTTAAPTTAPTVGPSSSPLETAVTTTTVIHEHGGGPTAASTQSWADADLGAWLSVKTDPAADQGNNSSKSVPVGRASAPEAAWTDQWPAIPSLTPTSPSDIAPSDPDSTVDEEIGTRRPTHAFGPWLDRLAFTEDSRDDSARGVPGPGGGLLVTAGAGLIATFALSRLLRRPSNL